MLHVTNGGCAAEVLRASGVGGEVLRWDDVLHEGPVPRVPPRELREIRAAFLGGPETQAAEVLRDLTLRDERLAKAAAGGEDIVLWFEHDLYDQLQLLQVLDLLAGERIDWHRVTLLCGDEYLGLSTPERLRQRLPERAPITPEVVDVARPAWDAFRDPEPTALLPLATARDSSSSLPFLAPALRRHLQQFPSTFNGLSRSEQQALEAIAAGAATVREAFVAAQRQENPIFLGDTVFADYLKELSAGPAPLVTLREGGGLMDASVALTGTGAAVLRGAADRVHTNGIDRWFGGVHLEGHHVAWRWDGTTIQRRA